MKKVPKRIGEAKNGRTARRSPFTCASLSVLSLALVSAPGPGFLIRYDIRDLGTFGGATSVALGINNKGQVVGGADGPDGLRRAYLWDDGSLTDLGNIGRVAHHGAWDINEKTQIVGTVTATGNIEDAFLWEKGQMTELGDPAQAKSAFAINDAGQIVGAAIFPPPISAQHAMLLEEGVLTDLGTLGGQISLAWDINNLGQVTGESFTDGSPGGAFLWESGVMSNLGTLGGGGSESRSINDRTEIVGFSSRADGAVAAFLWQDGKMTDIGLVVEPLFGFVNSSAEAINNEGQIVGDGTIQFSGATGSVAGFTDEGFLFDPLAGPVLLRDTLPPDSGWSAIVPRDINDNGWIVGSATTSEGFPNRAFLMTPLPPIPATSPMLLFALTAGVLTAAYVLLTKRAAQSQSPTQGP